MARLVWKVAEPSRHIANINYIDLRSSQSATNISQNQNFRQKQMIFLALPHLVFDPVYYGSVVVGGVEGGGGGGGGGC